MSDDDENPNLGVVLFRNSQWAVTDYGMESIKPAAPYHYHFTADRLLENRNGSEATYDWPVHMAEKSWVDIEDFITAFEKAIDIHHGRYIETLDPDRLAASLTAARQMKRRYRA